MTPSKCPLCLDGELRHEEVKGRGDDSTHMFFCPECPFVGMEFYRDADATRACKRLKQDVRTSP